MKIIFTVVLALYVIIAGTVFDIWTMIRNPCPCGDCMAVCDVFPIGLIGLIFAMGIVILGVKNETRSV